MYYFPSQTLWMNICAQGNRKPVLKSATCTIPTIFKRPIFRLGTTWDSICAIETLETITLLLYVDSDHR